MKRWLLLVVMAAARPAAGQSAGESGAVVLQFDAGARAAALAGAYSSAHGDADALFYNPAGMAAARSGASVSYESRTADITLGSSAAFTRIGWLHVGASLVYLDAGEIHEVVPDPAFGFNTGMETGDVVHAGELAARLSLALPIMASLRVGASAGFVSVNVAEVTERAAIADVGLQYDIAGITLSAAVRNLGGRFGRLRQPLAAELRVGALVPVLNAAGVGAQVFVDGVSAIHEGAWRILGGVEAGLVPAATRDVGAVVRIGYDAEERRLGAFRFGAGLSLRSASFDYAYQSLDLGGAGHRLGVRWRIN